MTSTQYEIKVKNLSGSTQTYFLFQQIPQVGNALGETYTNIYLTSTPTANKTGTADFKVQKKLYAICGTNTGSLGVGVTCTTTDYEAVVLGSSKNPGTFCPVTCAGGGIIFDQPNSQTIDASGQYAIKTKPDFQYPDPENRFAGLGAEDPTDSSNIVPVATFPVKPDLQYTVAPVTKYYVSTGSYEQGEIIDVTTLGEIATIDFTGINYTTATVVHNDDGTYSLPAWSAVAPTLTTPYLPPMIGDISVYADPDEPVDTDDEGDDDRQPPVNDPMVQITVNGHFVWAVGIIVLGGTVGYLISKMKAVTDISFTATAAIKGPMGTSSNFSFNCEANQAAAKLAALEQAVKAEDNRTAAAGPTINTPDPVKALTEKATVTYFDREMNPVTLSIKDFCSRFPHETPLMKKKKAMNGNSLKVKKQATIAYQNAHSNGY